MSLIIEGISKRYLNASKNTLNDINLEVKKGEFVCLLGASGCGKSTLLNIIAGLEKPTEGRIILNDKVITEPGPDRTVMFQEAALFPWLNVINNVKFGMKLAKVDPKEQEERAMYYLNMVNLAKFKDYRIHQLSGGMKQRVALARALTFDSEILLMDEPFAALDKQTINLLSEELQNIWSKTGKTIIFVTHSVEEALFHATRIVMMCSETGKIKRVFDISMERPRHKEEHEFVELRKAILSELRYEVEKVAEKEHDTKWHIK